MVIRRAFWALTIVAAAGCSKTKEPTGVAPNFDRRSMLMQIGEDIILPTYREFATSTSSMATTVQAFASARATGPAPRERAAAQQAWRSAMKIWQRAELMQIGPAASAGPGSAFIRDEIYSFPTVNPCRVDQEIVKAEYAQAAFFSTRLVNAYGMDALEYLLFFDESGNKCGAGIDINQGPWAGLSDEQKSTRRAAYASIVAGQIDAEAKRLVQAWAPGGGNFLGQLAAGNGQMGIDDLFAALFYIELRAKDDKLATPAGISMDCSTATCPDQLESPFSQTSKENIIENLRAFRELFQGGAGLGFDDLLIAVGSEALSTQILDAANAAETSAASVQGSFTDALASNPGSVRAVHASLKTMTDLLKSQFVTVLALEVPDEGAADND